MMGQIRTKILQPTEEDKAPQLPQHDWAEKALYITPTAVRFIDKIGAGIEKDGIYQVFS